MVSLLLGIIVDLKCQIVVDLTGLLLYHHCLSAHMSSLFSALTLCSRHGQGPCECA